MEYTVPRGTRDILPEEMPLWHFVEDTSRQVFEQYGFEEIRTPIFEHTDLFLRSIGEDTDIVSKEMYTFNDRKGRSLTLRPEGTASIVRAYCNNAYDKKGGLFKVWYSGPMFRYERPQAGRFRQFYQVGCELIGAGSALADAEIISLAIYMFHKMGMPDLHIKINSVGCNVCRPVIRERIKSFLGDNLKYLCSDCVNRFEKNPLRILDCKNPKCQNYFSGLPDLKGVLCQPCQDHFNSTLEYLEEAHIDYKIDYRLVRGLDYYNKTVFEIVSHKLGSQDAVCGGGRYDKLVEEFGGASKPAVGFAFGVERAVMILQDLHISSASSIQKKLFIIALGELSRTRAFTFAHELRKKKCRVEMNLEEGTLKSQLKRADKEKADLVLIIGEDEIQKKMAVLKDMQSGKQEDIKFDKLVPTLEALLAGA